MCDPISSNSIENATPSSGTSPLASYRKESELGVRATTIEAANRSYSIDGALRKFHLPEGRSSKRV